MIGDRTILARMEHQRRVAERVELFDLADEEQVIAAFVMADVAAHEARARAVEAGTPPVSEST